MSWFYKALQPSLMEGAETPIISDFSRAVAGGYVPTRDEPVLGEGAFPALCPNPHRKAAGAAPVAVLPAPAARRDWAVAARSPQRLESGALRSSWKAASPQRVDAERSFETEVC